MADGTVTGEFRLYTVQARRELERLQREGKDTDVQMERLGRDLDSVGSRKHQTQIRQTSTEVRKLGTTSKQASRGVGSLEHEVSRLAIAIDRANSGGRGGGTRAAAVRTGGGGGGVRGGILGLSGGIKLMAAQATIALPVIRTLAGAVGALGAVAGSAATGGAAVGAAGVVGLATGLGGILSVAGPVSKEIKAIADAQKRYNDAIRQYGKASEQAGTARRELRTARRQGPAGAGALVSEARAFSREWNRATQSSQEGLVKFYREVVATGRKLERPLAGIANQVTNAFSAQGTQGMRFLRSQRVQKGLKAGGDIFTENLGNVRRVGQATVEMFLNITRASKPFVKEFTDFMAKWFGEQAGRTRNIREMRRSIGSMVDDLKSVGRLGGAGIRLLLAIMGQGRRPGRGLLDSATAQLDKWTKWIRENPGKVQSFFRTAADDARKLASAVADIVRLLAGLAETLRPILPMISTLASVAGSVGGAGTIGLAGAGLAGFRAARGKPGGPGLIGTMLGRGRGAGGAAGAATRMGAGGMAKAGLMAAGKAYWPIAAGMAGLTAAGTEGTIDRKAQAAASSLTFGLISAPETYDEARGKGAQDAASFASAIPITAGGNRRLKAQRDAAARALAGTVAGTSSRATKDFKDPVTGEQIRKGQVIGGQQAIRGPQRERLEEEKKALDDELKARQEVVKSLRAERELRRAPGEARDVRRAFRYRTEHGGAAAAAKGVVPDVMQKVRAAKTPEGAEAAAEANLKWLRQVKKDNPKLEAAYDDLTKKIKRKFRRMGRDIEIVHGRIYKDSKSAWRNIKNSLTSATEQAKQEANKDFTEIQRMAVRGLMQMGWSRGDARKIISGQEAGGTRAGAADVAVRTGSTYEAGIAGGQTAGPSQSERRARGGRLGGRGLHDSVPVPGGLAAPGELVVNRHTEARHDADARSHGLPTLAQRVKHERRPHHAPKSDAYFAVGGRTGNTRAAQLGGGLMGASAGLAPYAALGASFGLSVSSGARPGSITSSGNVSLHSSGNAIDISGPTGAMLQFAQAMASQYGSGLNELIHTPLGFGIKNGQRVPPYAAADHYDHVHVGDSTPGGVAGGLPGGAMVPGGAAPSINIRTPGVSARGAPGGMVKGSNKALAAGMQRMLNDRMGGGMMPTGGGAVSAGGAFDKGRLANLWTTAGGDPGVANLMAAIALAESNGNPAAHNPSGASGLWQILGNPFPGNPMDPMTNARMAVSKYKSQGLGAWEAYTRGMHSKYMAKGGRVHNAGWFRNGGSFQTNGPTVFGAGEGGTENVSITKGGAAGGRPIMVNITMGTVKVASVSEAGGVGEQIGRQVASQIARALREAPAVA